MKYDECNDWPEVIRWEPSGIEFSEAINPNIAPALGWSCVLRGYDATGKLLVTRQYSIDIEGYTQLMQTWLSERGSKT